MTYCKCNRGLWSLGGDDQGSVDEESVAGGCWVMAFYSDSDGRVQCVVMETVCYFRECKLIASWVPSFISSHDRYMVSIGINGFT